MNEPTDSAIQNATPRTDKAEYDAIANTNSALLSNDKQYVVLASFARSLERDRSLAVSALKAAAYALNSPDAHRRKVVAELVIACLTQMGETLEIP